MKKIILLCTIAILGIVFTGSAQGAKIEFETETLDYGTIEHMSDGHREFVFTNTGDSPLFITKAKGSCGCTVPTWPKEGIAAGESSTIKVKYATDRIGAFTKTITIASNAVNAPSKVIKIKGKVNSPQETDSTPKQ
jgi:hypothetical protein